MRFLSGIVINALLFMALSGFFSSFYVDGFMTALIASVVLAILNLLVRPVLLLLTLPINFFTLGLFTFVVNAVMLELTSYLVGARFEIANFGVALLIAALMAFANMVINSVIGERKAH